MANDLTGREVLAIDAGTQGISVLLWCPERHCTLGVGGASYEHPYIPGRPGGRLEQYAHYWSNAMVVAMCKLRVSLKQQGLSLDRVAGIGVTGHMHCMVRRDTAGLKPFACDMWNDPRGPAEAAELAPLLGEQLPARWTACHILASLRAEPDVWKNVSGVTVTSGSLVHDLTGEWVLGPGDASGMFGRLDERGQIDVAKLKAIQRAAGAGAPALEKLAPRIVPAGEVAGRLTESGSRLLGGLPVGTPVAAPEGDQQAVLVGAAADDLELALSAGTSFSGNLPCRAFLKAESEAYNVLHTPDGQTMVMVCVRNGTVGFANYVEGLSRLAGVGFGEMADRLTDLAVKLPPDLYGVNLHPFFQGENVVGLPDARASLSGAGLELLSNPGVMARLLLEAPCFTLRYGLEKLEAKIGSVRRVLLTGGALKSKDGFAAQLFADSLGVPVSARAGDEEGSGKGAAVLAAYMTARESGNTMGSLSKFAQTQVVGTETVWQPRPENRATSNARFRAFCSTLPR